MGITKALLMKKRASGCVCARARVSLASYHLQSRPLLSASGQEPDAEPGEEPTILLRLFEGPRA